MFGLPFQQVWLLDTEYISESGGRPLPSCIPVCLVARELNSNRLIRLWQDQLGSEPPFPVGDDSLFVCFQAAAEWSFFLAVGWPLPTRVLDLYVENLHRTNDGRPRAKGTTKLLAALRDHGISSITSEEKTEMRDLVLRGGPWSSTERRQILDYCQTDVDPLAALLERMLPFIRSHPEGLAQAVIRGRFAAAQARIERTGIPLDAELLGRIRRHRDTIRRNLIDDVDENFGVFRGGEFKHGLFRAYLYENKMDWPNTPSGLPDTRNETFRDMAGRYPPVTDLGQLIKTLRQLQSEKISVSSDGRNRYWLNPFGSVTGRNYPPGSTFIYGQSKWMRGLVKPVQGKALAYLDWRSQEVFVAAKLSGDKQLLEATQRGDPYIELAKLAGLAPQGATKHSHRSVRDTCKTCFLGVAYGMGAESLAMRTGLTLIESRDLIRELARAFPDFYEWADHIVHVGQLSGYLTTEFGWTFQIGDVKPNTIRNYLVQANGAEMMRIASCLITERGIRLCCSLHDAVLVEGDEGEINDVVAQTQRCMAEASRAVLDGIEIDTEVEHVVRWPDRLLPEDGRPMWNRVMESLAALDGDGNHG